MTFEADMSEWWTKPPSQSVFHPRSVFGGTMSCTKDEKNWRNSWRSTTLRTSTSKATVHCHYAVGHVASSSAPQWLGLRFSPFKPCRVFCYPMLSSVLIMQFTLILCRLGKKTHLDTYRDACGTKILMLV